MLSQKKRRFDDNMLEQHFLRMTYLDRNRENFTYPPVQPYHPEPYLYDHPPENPSFAIDSEGTIYLTLGASVGVSGCGAGGNNLLDLWFS